jgi:competence protein ComEC
VSLRSVAALDDPGRADLRLVPAAASTWAGSGWAVAAPAGEALAVGGCALLVALVLLAVRRRPAAVVAATALAAGGAVVLVAAGHLAVRDSGLLAGLTDQAASVRLVATVTDDPTPVRPDPERGWAPAKPRWTVGLDVTEVTGRGMTTSARAPVLLVGGAAWTQVQLGERVEATGRLVAADAGDDVVALLIASGAPRGIAPPPGWQRGAEQLRAGLRTAAEPLPRDAGALLPGLVVGDTSALPADLEEDMKLVGLTHLCAVSGSNVAIVCGTVLLVAGACGAGRRTRLALAGAALVGFVVLARPDPSVLRAGVMGVVGLLGLASGRTRRGVPALAGAVVVLTAFDPWLSRSFGFALSVLATAALLLLARSWAEHLARWMPLPLAQAVAVPAAAQAVCAPVVVLLTPQVALLAVPANVLVAPAVAPATVLGVVATVVAPWWPAGAGAVAWVAGWATSWIALVARVSADLPFAAVGWPGGWSGAVLLAGATAAAAVVGGLVLRARRESSLAGRDGARAGIDRRLVLVVAGVVAVVGMLLGPARSPGGLPWAGPTWPPSGWQVVACDVGQGDALVVSTGPGTAVVVDVGPDAAAVDRCLSRLGVVRVDLLVLTHFHSDHVDGVEGLLDGREVAGALVSPLRVPTAGAERSLLALQAAGISVTDARAGQRGGSGPVTWDVVWPEAAPEVSGSADEQEGSDVNDASVVLLLQVAGLRLLATGDVEPGAQEQVRRRLEARAASGADVRVDVLKVAHHGSSHQDAALHRLVAPRVALVSAGADNDYGHPAPAALALLESVGAVVARTDVHGDVAVGLRAAPAGTGAADGADLWVSGSRADPVAAGRRRDVAGCRRGRTRSISTHVAGRRSGAGDPGHRHGGAARRPRRRGRAPPRP